MDGIYLRDEVMGFELEELILLGDRVRFWICSDGRLTEETERMAEYMRKNGQAVTIHRIIGGTFFTEETISALKNSGVLKEDETQVVLGHERCAAAENAEEILAGKSENHSEAYNVIFKSFRDHDFKSRKDVELKGPIIAKARIEEVCKIGDLGERKIIAGSIPTPNISAAPANERVLIVTSPLTCSYRELGLDPKSISNYYVENFLEATMADIKFACQELGITKIRLIAQNASENVEILRLHAKLGEDSDLKRLKVEIPEPKLAEKQSRIGRIYMPQATQPSPSPQNRKRATL